MEIKILLYIEYKNAGNNNKLLLLLLLLLLLTAIGLSPGGSGYFTCTQNMKLVTNKFNSGGLHEKQLRIMESGGGTGIGKLFSI